ncbi:MAG TPA: DUF6445 family protein [Vicinamibacterales bacterium]|nr:DUF6445 family protein [Vicinamibacterales bacterium]
MALPSFIMIDDFLPEPEAARRQAVQLNYDRALKDGNYPGVLSDRPLPIQGLDEAVSKVLGVPVEGAPGTVHGHCRLTLRSERGLSGVHIDPTFYSGILYLSAPEHCRGGTDFYRHRRTGLDRVPANPLELVRAGYNDVNELIEDVVNRDTMKPARWEKTFTAPMRFNRLILFSPWMFHNSAAGFGDRPDNGRLVYLMFFAARSA